MTRYEQLQEEKNNFLKAAKKTSDKNIAALWKYRASEIQERINNLTVEEAAKEI